MSHETLPLDAARQVLPSALTGHARALGWQHVPNGKRHEISVFRRPDSPLHQVIIPTDTTLADYDEAVADVVRKLAEYERLPAGELLERLLLPPADLLSFGEVSPDAQAGHLPLDHAVHSLTGTRRLLLSAAHSALSPRPYHPRLSRSEAEEFVGSCRLGQTQRGSFILNVACPLGAQLPLPGVGEPFSRRVTSLLLRSLAAVAAAAEQRRADHLLDLSSHPGMSANLCEALLLLRPAGDRASLTVTAAWSRTLPPTERETIRPIQLRQDAFEIAEGLAGQLRSQPQPKRARLIGFVDGLRGQPVGDDPRPSGEVEFTLFDDGQGELRARGVLSADDYAIAGAAHLRSDVVSFRAVLQRLPRVSRVDSIADFEVVSLDDKADPEVP